MKSILKNLVICLSFILIISSCKKDESYTLTLSVSPENSGTVTGAGVYKSGEIVNITATSNAGYLFINWTNGDTEVSKEENFTYTTIATNVTLRANFEKKIIVKMGAQSNTSFGSFYSIGQDIVFTQDAASTHQDTIDLLCFYENVAPSKINNITLSSAGANYTGIFTGTTSPDLWTVKRLTTFTPPANPITTAQFDQLFQNDATIMSYYNSTITTSNKKAKDLKVDDIYAFKTHDNIYGLFKVISVTQNANGYVEFELKLKK